MICAHWTDPYVLMSAPYTSKNPRYFLYCVYPYPHISFLSRQTASVTRNDQRLLQPQTSFCHPAHAHFFFVEICRSTTGKAARKKRRGDLVCRFPIAERIRDTYIYINTCIHVMPIRVQTFGASLATPLCCPMSRHLSPLVATIKTFPAHNSFV